MTYKRKYNTLDNIINIFDDAMRTLLGIMPPSLDEKIVNDRDDEVNQLLTKHAKYKSACLMRVNHTGEICAQALYRGQALTADSEEIKLKLRKAVIDEEKHLRWCISRLRELDSRPSILGPFFYCGSFIIGVLIGKLGDNWSLGFIAEAERQVIKHLSDHLDNYLPISDVKSQNILRKMRDEEAYHVSMAIDSGGIEFPKSLSLVMYYLSKVMTITTYWL